MKKLIKNSLGLINKGLKQILIILSLLIVSTGVFIIFSLQKIEIKKDIVFLIPKQTRIRSVSKMLAEEDAIDYQGTFYLFAKLYCKVYGKYVIAGEYSLKKGSNAFDILNIITSGKVIQHSITIPEGFTVKQILQKIEERENIRHFPDIQNIKEGSLLPETYYYTYGTFDITIIKRMQEMMTSLLATEWPKRDKSIDRMISSPEEAVILASIVEKETYIVSEKPIIAGVYLNRLRKNMRLQADPTVIYGLNLVGNTSWKGRVLYSHLRSDSEYNTYRHKGLPPTPICNPGKASIIAVLHPKWSHKMFFVSIGGGKHIYAENFEQHRRNISSARSG